MCTSPVMQAQAALQYAKPLSTPLYIVSQHSQRLYAYFYKYKYICIWVYMYAFIKNADW